MPLFYPFDCRSNYSVLWRGGIWCFVGREAVDDIAGTTVDVAREYERASYQYQVDIGDVDLSVAVVHSILSQALCIKSQYVSQTFFDCEIDLVTMSENYLCFKVL